MVSEESERIHPVKKLVAVLILLVSCVTAFARPRWTPQQANTWYKEQPWLVGSNFIPQDAINQLEMWQADTFDAAEIDRELGWAQAIGMNTMRVFLHDLLWQQDPAGFQQRINQFLVIADKHHIKPLFVLFDSCWNPHPALGLQKKPTPGVHNSGWVQSPGTAALEDPTQVPRLKAYVTGVIGAFAKDQRILGWDLWNEPDNINDRLPDEPKNKREIVAQLLPRVFEWARSVNPTQPLTSGVWTGSPEQWRDQKRWSAIQSTQFTESDVISFHNYSKPASFEAHVLALQKLNRPILCTEFMARPEGSTFDGILPLAKKYHVAAINWGLVVGKTQTNLPWDSWSHPYIDKQPDMWFHEVFYSDGRPYRDSETQLIKQLTGVTADATRGH